MEGDEPKNQEDIEMDDDQALFAKLREKGSQLTKALVDIMEIDSLPRVSVEAKKMGLRAGLSMDLTNGWDLTNLADRELAEKYVDEHEPWLVMGSPMRKM